MEVGSGPCALSEFALSFALFLGFSSHHLFVRFKQRNEVSSVVFLVSAAMLLNAISALVVSLGLLLSQSSLSVWIGFAIILCFLLLSCLLFLVARGLFVLSPTLSDAATVHARQLLALCAALAIAALLFCLPLPERVVFSIQIAAAFLLLLFVCFLVIRLFQAVKATRAAIDM
jgi:hypothetical protein